MQLLTATRGQIVQFFKSTEEKAPTRTFGSTPNWSQVLFLYFLRFSLERPTLVSNQFQDQPFLTLSSDIWGTLVENLVWTLVGPRFSFELKSVFMPAGTWPLPELKSCLNSRLKSRSRLLQERHEERARPVVARHPAERTRQGLETRYWQRPQPHCRCVSMATP